MNPEARAFDFRIRYGDSAYFDADDTFEAAPPRRVGRPRRTNYEREIRAGRRQGKAPVGEPGLSWWATTDRSELSAEAERRQQAMSASKEGRRWRPAINDA